MSKGEFFFAIAVQDYIDPQYGAADYPDRWCVAEKRYCHSINYEKIRKFKTYQEAEDYIKSRRSRYKKGRNFSIMFAAILLRGGIAFYDVASPEEAEPIALRVAGGGV